MEKEEGEEREEERGAAAKGEEEEGVEGVDDGSGGGGPDEEAEAAVVYGLLRRWRWHCSTDLREKRRKWRGFARDFGKEVLLLDLFILYQGWEIERGQRRRSVQFKQKIAQQTKFH